MYIGTPRWLSSKEHAYQCRRHRLDHWVRKSPWRGKWHPTFVFLPGKSHGQRSLTGYSPWARKESDVTEQACTVAEWLHIYGVYWWAFWWLCLEVLTYLFWLTYSFSFFRTLLGHILSRWLLLHLPWGWISWPYNSSSLPPSQQHSVDIAMAQFYQLPRHALSSLWERIICPSSLCFLDKAECKVIRNICWLNTWLNKYTKEGMEREGKREMGKVKIKGQIKFMFDPKDYHLRFLLRKVKVIHFLLLYPFVLWFLSLKLYTTISSSKK